MDEAKRVLDNSIVSMPCLPVGYKQLPLSPPLADPTIGQESSLVDPAPSEIQIQESIPDKPLVVGSVELALSTVHQVFSVESGSHTPHVLLVSSDSSELEKDSPVPVLQEVSPPPPKMEATEDFPPAFEMEVVEDAPSSSVTPGEDHLSSMVAPPSILFASFDWNRFAGYRLPSYVPFEITVQAFGLVVPSTIIDEGASVSILSSTTWQAFGSPPLAPFTQNLLNFNRSTS